MRYQILKLTKSKSTKSERRFMELLKELHIRFKSKIKIGGREIDFVIGVYAIDLDGHLQDPEKNKMLLNNKYIPIHLNNKDIIKSNKNIKKWLEQIILQKQ